MSVSAASDARRAAVLIVDDDPLSIEVLAEALNDEYEIRFATSGAEALQMLEATVPDLLLLDMLLPDTDGYALYARVKAQPPTRELPVIFVTSMRDPVSEAKGLEMGAADYITKPISPPIVRARVRNHIELARARTELVASRNDALAAARAKAAFLATMSHEIRTPLNGVIGMAGLLQGTRLDADQREFVETIRVSGDALLTLINDVLDFSKIDSGKLALESAPVVLREVIEDACEILGAKAREKALDLSYSLAPDVPAAIYGDATRLRQVLINLVSNAVKFTERGEVGIDVRWTAAGAGAGLLEMQVRDTGIGIAADRINLLFDPFTQADSSTTRVYGGTGLGLAICKRLVDCMGGTITVDSVAGQGSTFRFTVQTREAPDPSQAFTQAVRASLGGKRALVVDGNATSLNNFRQQLEAWGMTVMAVAGAPAALDVLRREPAFDVALLDMPRTPTAATDTEALARQIHACGAGGEVPLILLSPVYMPSEAAGKQYRARLTRPVRQSQLHDAIMTVLGIPAIRIAGGSDTALDLQLAAKYPLNLLVADDNAVNRKVAEATLARFGYRAQFVENGRQAVESVSQAVAAGNKFDLVFMDVQMPVLDGLDATRVIKSAQGENAPVVIALTAAASPEDRMNCLKSGMDDYAAKPFTARELQATISRWGARLQRKSA